MRVWNWRGIFLALLCGALLGLGRWAGQVQAQEPLGLDTLTVSLWPEYDREGVLVIYRGTVTAGTPLPAILRFRVPKTMASLGGTAGVDAQGAFHYYKPSVQDLGTVLEVTYTTPYPAFQFEYYDGALQAEGEARTYTFTYPAVYRVGLLALEAQEPAGAEGFATEPEGALADDPLGSGLKVRRWVVGAAEAGQPLTFRVEYRKVDPRLSAEILGLPTPGTSPYEDVPRGQPGGVSGWVVAGLAVAAAGGVLAAVYFGWLRPRQRAAGPAPRPRPRRRAPRRKQGPSAAPRAAPSPPARFCHQCGTELGPKDRFCPQCGARRKGSP
ncbi:MAG: zinc ribbon domain-containing protein [Anaerolineae bacterium]